MKKNLILTAILCVLPLWWIFQILWLPGFMHVVADFSYRFEPIQISTQTATSARNRAFEYATRGGGKSDDIYFTNAEVSHLVDVSRLFKPIFLGLNILAVVAWSILILAVYKKVQFDKPLQFASKLLALFVGLLLLCLFAFSVFFEHFHRILFPGGNWAFPADSLLITIFPEAFWKLELFSILLFLVIFILLYHFLRNQFCHPEHSSVLTRGSNG